MRPEALGRADHLGEARLRREVVGVVGVVGVVVPVVPVDAQPLAEECGGAADGVQRVVGHVAGADPGVGVVAPLRDVARGERLAAPFGRVGEGAVPAHHGVLPALRSEACDRLPRQAERALVDPSGRGGDGVAEDHFVARALRRVGLAAAPAVLRAVVEGPFEVVYDDELHGRGVRRVARLEGGDVERFLYAPALRGQHLAVGGAVDRYAGKFEVGHHPPFGQVGLDVPAQQFAAVGQRDVHAHGVAFGGVVQRELPGEHQRLAFVVVADCRSVVGGVFGHQAGILALRPFII